MLGRLHHLGIAVRDIEGARALFEQLMGYRLTDGPYDDPIQKVRVAFLERPGDPLVVELVAPGADDAPVHRYLARGVGAYHVCYEVANIDEALAGLRARRCIIVSGPDPAVAFGGRRIAWAFTPTQQLLEVVERA